MIDHERLARFERQLEPWRDGRLPDGARLLGYGEISAVITFADVPGVALKRMPLFARAEQAQAYTASYRRYTGLLREAGLELPEDDAQVVALAGRPVVLYLAQRLLPPERFGHALVRRCDEAGARQLFDAVFERLARVFDWNASARPRVELGLDGQLSNWAELDGARLVYVDTSTPLHRLDGVEQLDPELFLASAPAPLRPLLRHAFLGEVMGRYYDRRRVFLDLVANLHKEQRPDLVPLALGLANARLESGQPPLSAAEARRYYAADKRVWSVFLALRRLDRWLTTRILRRRYEFLLPGPIQR